MSESDMGYLANDAICLYNTTLQYLRMKFKWTICISVDVHGDERGDLRKGKSKGDDSIEQSIF